MRSFRFCFPLCLESLSPFATLITRRFPLLLWGIQNTRQISLFLSMRHNGRLLLPPDDDYLLWFMPETFPFSNCEMFFFYVIETCLKLKFSLLAFYFGREREREQKRIFHNIRTMTFRKIAFLSTKKKCHKSEAVVPISSRFDVLRASRRRSMLFYPTIYLRS